MNPNEVEEFAGQIADGLMSMNTGEKADRLQLMQASGDDEINLGGRNRTSVIETIEEFLQSKVLIDIETAEEIQKLRAAHSQMHAFLGYMTSNAALLDHDPDDPDDAERVQQMFDRHTPLSTAIQSTKT